jgi:hypothetical protein
LNEKPPPNDGCRIAVGLTEAGLSRPARPDNEGEEQTWKAGDYGFAASSFFGSSSLIRSCALASSSAS